MRTRELKIEGMSCQHCVRALEKELGAVPGLEVRRVEVGRAEVRVPEEGHIDEGHIDDAIARAVEQAGFVLKH